MKTIPYSSKNRNTTLLPWSFSSTAQSEQPIGCPVAHAIDANNPLIFSI